MAEQSKDSPGKMKSKHSDTERFVPYIRGFSPRPKRERMEAIGFDVKNIPLPYSPMPENDFFGPLQRPTHIDDWLANNREDGQTFRGFQWQSPWLTNRSQRNWKKEYNGHGKTLSERYRGGKIYIVPVGNIDPAYIRLEDVMNYVEEYLCIPVALAPGMKLEQEGDSLFLVEESGERTEIEMRYEPETKHSQISILSILPEIKSRLPDDALCLIGLTMFDLYGDEEDLFMAGLAQWNENIAVFSIFRYDPRLTFSTELWYDVKSAVEISDDVRMKLVLQRSCKLVVHEIGHLLGIDHCVYFDCCMNGSGHLEEDFRQPMHLCPVDLHKLQVLTGFHVVERYEKLLQFYRKHGLEEEAHWVNRRLQFIKDGGKPKGQSNKKKTLKQK